MPRASLRNASLMAALLAAAPLLGLSLAACWPAAIGVQVVSRDAFPVFTDPPLASAEEAEREVAIFPRDAVIGVVLNGEARAYPISVMGMHELGNDTLAGVPIAVSW